MGRVEVVVRLAGDLLDVIEVPDGDTFWVGMTLVRAKAGSEAAFGLVTVTMSAAPRERDRVPRKRVEARPYVYGAASLIAQIAIVVIAFATAKDEPLSAPAIEAKGTRPGGVRIKRFAMPSQTVQRTPDPSPDETPVTVDDTPEQEDEHDTPAPQEVTDFSPSEMTGGGLITDGRKESDGTSHFDPSENPAFDSVKVGDYSTVSTGRSAGDDYGPEARNPSLVVITCDRASCLVVGGAKAVRVRKAVNEHLAEITDCYKRAAASGGGKVEIDFDVDRAGTVGDVDVGEADPAGSCVARIIRSLQIDPMDETAEQSG